MHTMPTRATPIPSSGDPVALAGAQMDSMLTAEGIAAIVDLHHHPFGNSYFPTKACGGAPYDPQTRHCWANTCVGNSSPQPDCFSGTPIVQHGETEYDVNKVQACAQPLTAGDGLVTQRYWPFVVCMEKAYGARGEKAARSCATKSGIDYAQLNACYMGAAGDAAVVAQAKATIDHPGTPYVAVNGHMVEPDKVLAAVCAAYGGTLPAGCPKA